jgi:hypothetical protein
MIAILQSRVVWDPPYIRWAWVLVLVWVWFDMWVKFGMSPYVLGQSCKATIGMSPCVLWQGCEATIWVMQFA